MTVCPKCKFYNICKGRLNETVDNCVRFKSVEMTNEEWFCGLSTREKAETISRLSYYHGNIYEIEMWLKQPHTEKE